MRAKRGKIEAKRQVNIDKPKIKYIPTTAKLKKRKWRRNGDIKNEKEGNNKVVLNEIKIFYR